MAKVKIKPLGDRILIEAIEGAAEQVKGGIVIPDSAKEKPLEYKVVALGTGKCDDNGNKIAFDVKEGDIVLTNKYGGTEVKCDDKEYKIVSADDILAVIG
ncbi:MAG: co-chaperone GroES [Lentisphaerae bacterium]|nr:co-chaperone GroES [Lentisphaerota bacterium]MCP4100884.1 co-chaperone GroES [Lentisphaerota bacterium]